MIDFKLGDKVTVLIGKPDGRRNNEIKKVSGKLVYKNKCFFTLFVEKHGKCLYRESFMFKEKLEIHKH